MSTFDVDFFFLNKEASIWSPWTSTRNTNKLENLRMKQEQNCCSCLWQTDPLFLHQRVLVFSFSFCGPQMIIPQLCQYWKVLLLWRPDLISPVWNKHKLIWFIISKAPDLDGKRGKKWWLKPKEDQSSQNTDERAASWWRNTTHTVEAVKVTVTR